MAYRLTPQTPLVPAKDQQGHIRYHYQHNPIIPWLNDEQREHFLRLGLVEEIVEDAKPGAKPNKTAPQDKWVDYGVTQGHDRAELEALSKPELVDLLS
ncbi:hypothetical protein KXD96_27980 (plasmid) [Mycobacterium sp. SMC-2]|uniref:hypothetical protein n=1 Tax=Mycobacterium sp. SMC-2 TaxID=2857058 RepID=UPI0021B33CD0|nr:hypothetical protein [Mycobacterium sp. SMC-2]UXA06582.1 hypothetical protein KXD96_27845 [Mycobacterium sp. SMC-2]UXA09672.1 hypothetical protein KXD96_27980 [Mycobacterium sp. SMC-2]